MWIIEEEISLLNFLKKVVGEACSVKGIKRSIDNRGAQVNGRIERFASKRLKPGDRVEFDLKTETKISEVLKLYEDEYLLVIDKPSGWLCEEQFARKQLGNVWLVHRLDKETSGVLLIAKTIEAKNRLETLFAERKIQKQYLALVHGAMLRDTGKIESPIKSKSASTTWKCLKKGKSFSLLECSPYTGRTHQIRIHLRQIGHPIIGDLLYGLRRNEKGVQRLLLHAHRLHFNHPFSQEELSFEAPIPTEILDASFD
jgi:23S rRNA pseudouridine955/2504/2580 synthase